jgi:hypothetical protein
MTVNKQALPFKAYEVEEELTDFLNAMTPEKIRELKARIVAGHVHAGCYCGIWPNIFNPLFMVGCIAGLAAQVCDISWPEMFKRAGHDPDEMLELERAVRGIRPGMTPDNNEVLAFIVEMIDDYLNDSLETEDDVIKYW